MSAPKVWSLWIYDRHCTLIYHADWSRSHPDAPAFSRRPRAPGATLLPGVSRAVPPPTRGAQQQPAPAGSRLALDEEGKLVYGVVFSLRNMARKLNGSQEVFSSYSTATYTLSHLHVPTSYTFVLITDPVAPPRAAGAPVSTGAAGGGIPGTGGMSTTGVLAQIWRGPWAEYVVRNPLAELERESGQAGVDGQPEGRRFGVDSDALREGIERVFAQNKLHAPPSM